MLAVSLVAGSFLVVGALIVGCMLDGYQRIHDVPSRSATSTRSPSEMYDEDETSFPILSSLSVLKMISTTTKINYYLKNHA